jgi:glycosyltransferase involved in cell wall biosynthesis
VVSRWLQILDYLPKNLFKVLWLHDMPHELPDHITVNAVFTVSEFQAKAWHLPTEYTWVTSDGVDTSLFHPSTGPTDPTKLVWLSNPDRGLAVAARIFQDLRKRWPDLKLHVYGRSAVYGWSPAVEQPYLPAPDFMEGVILHEPLARAALADAIRDAFAMFYPTFWPETFCMAALEAQACGVPVICSDAGALSETVQGGIVGNDFLNAFSQLRNPTRWEKLSKRGLQFAEAHEWDNVAAGWVETFCAMRGVPCA